MSKAKRIHLAVFAITTGRSEVDRETVVHLDYKQASNIVDFLFSSLSKGVGKLLASDSLSLLPFIDSK